MSITRWEADQDYIWSKVESHMSLALLPRSASWCKLWDRARDHGFQGTRSLQPFHQILINHVHYVTLFYLKVLQLPTIYFHTSLVVLSIYWRYYVMMMKTRIFSQLKRNLRDSIMCIICSILFFCLCVALYFSCIPYGLTNMNFEWSRGRRSVLASFLVTYFF